ncbi:hypothetical protein HYU16_03345 [Candidatus Woesearchaeota archaeon]|nr:hypothetical protein [Candidatus Woesearchaeota archaeon]
MKTGSGENMRIAARLRDAQSLQDIFELAKEAVWKHLKVDQAGLMVGLAELGIRPEAVLGAYYSPDANTIVINRTVMNQVKQLADQQLYNSYCFYILLHEYLHSCGFYDESENRQIVAAIAAQEFGPDHSVTKFATTDDAMLKLIRAGMLSNMERKDNISAAADAGIEFVEGIDRSNTNYIM